MTTPTQRNGPPALSDEQIARELLDLHKLLVAARDSLKGAIELQASLEVGQRSLERVRDQVQACRQSLEPLAAETRAASETCRRSHAAVARLHEVVAGKIEEGRSTLQALDRLGGAEGLARIRKEILDVVTESRGLQEDFQTQKELHHRVRQDIVRANELLSRGRQAYEDSRKIAVALRNTFQRLGGGEGLVQAIARLKALEVSVEERLSGHDEEVSSLKEAIQAGDRKTRWLLAVACVVTVALATASSATVTLLLR